MSEAEMSAIRNVCVYCGSSEGADARFGEAAEALAQLPFFRGDF